jgi:hypothetical protein
MNLSLASKSNNLAITGLQQGKSVEALHLLQSVIADLKNQIDARKPDRKKEQQIAVVECHDNRCKQHQHDDFPCTSSSSGIRGHQESKICLQKTPRLTDMVNEKLLGQSAITTFDHALLVESPGEDEEILMAVVLYNCAIAEHILADGLSKALFLYKLSFAVILKSTSPLVLPLQVCLLIGALYNNMAHIYSENKCVLETGKCMQRLVELVASEEASAFIEHEDQALFYLNAFVQLNANAASAA